MTSQRIDSRLASREHLRPGRSQFGIEPAIDRQDRGLLPGEHAGQKVVLGGQGQLLDVHAGDRFVDIALQFVAEFRVAHQLVDFVGLGGLRVVHGGQVLICLPEKASIHSGPRMPST